MKTKMAASKTLSDNEMRALQLIRSTGGAALMLAGEALVNSHVATLIKGGYVKYGTARRPFMLTTRGYHVTDVPRNEV